jgi:ATP-dependent Clp protease ATP-binding subunit ClpA
VFERFTGRARRVVVLAQEEARMLNHNYIGTEHILLGLIGEGEGLAARALQSLRISLEAVRSEVESIVGQGQAAPTGHIPFTPRAKKVLELSLREALQLGHNYIGTEHILLGLIREGQGVAAQVLQKLGADLNRVRQQVIQVLSTSLRPPEQEGPALPELDPVRLADRGKRARTAAEAVVSALGSPDLTPIDVVIGLLMSEGRLSTLEEWARDPGAMRARIARLRSEEARSRASVDEPPEEGGTG